MPHMQLIHNQISNFTPPYIAKGGIGEIRNHSQRKGGA